MRQPSFICGDETVAVVWGENKSPFSCCMQGIKNGLYCFCLCLLLQGCFNRGYYFYVIAVHPHISQGDKVHLNGIEIGQITGIEALDSGRYVLTLSIWSHNKIPKRNTVKCVEDLLGSTYIDISSNAGAEVARQEYVHSNDTLYAVNEPRFRRLDSADQKLLLNKVIDLGNTADSILHKKK